MHRVFAEDSCSTPRLEKLKAVITRARSFYPGIVLSSDVAITYPVPGDRLPKRQRGGRIGNSNGNNALVRR